MSSTKEKWALVGLIVLIMAVNVSTIEHSPTVWIDEVTYSDPGVNLALGNGFTSSVWYSNSKDQIWAGNTPLYPLLLSGWISMFGLGIKEVRSLNYLLIVFSVTAIWWGLVRSEIVKRPATRLAVVALLLASYGPTFIYRSGRPDTLLVLLFSLIFLGCCLRSKPWRLGLIGFAALLIPFSGLGGLPYLVLCSALWLAVTRFRKPAEVFVAGLASAAGVASLFLSYSALGIWDEFRASTSAHTTLSTLAKGILPTFQRWGATLWGLRGDPSLLALFGGLVSLNVLALALRTWRPTKMSLTLLVFSALVPLCMMMIGVFPVYYAWMAFIPAVFSWAIWRDSALARENAKVLRYLLALLALTTLLVGLPLRTGIAVSQWDGRDYAPVEALCAAAIGAGDVVYCDPQAYYAAKKRAGVVFSGSYHQVMTEQEKDSVEILVIDPQSFDKRSRFLGGRWERIAADASVSAPRNRFIASTYNLAAWRRAAE